MDQRCQFAAVGHLPRIGIANDDILERCHLLLAHLRRLADGLECRVKMGFIFLLLGRNEIPLSDFGIAVSQKSEQEEQANGN